LLAAGSEMSLRELLLAYWPVPAAAFAVSLLSTPLCRLAAIKLDYVDRPDGVLKPHARPIAYLGGIAVFCGWIAGILVGLAQVGLSQFDLVATVGILVAGLAITATGLVDDILDIRPVTKVVCSVAVAAILLATGTGEDLFTIFRWFMPMPASRVWIVALSVPISVFIIVGACNATNLIDGMDGLCSGVLSIISIGFFVLAAHLALWGEPEPVDPLCITLSLAMAGGALGFLPYNRNPARIFLGDAGSMLLGFNAAVLILLMGRAGIVRWMVGALMIFGLPIYDMLLTLVRRWRNGRPLMGGDRSHFYDQLIDRGYTVRQVVAISYALTAFFVVLGCATMYIRTRYVICVYLAVTLCVAAVAWKLDMVRVESPASDAPETETPSDA
jgi:UDP-GlcNAc:undecaprenyl-phosphate GlcNAc-1-phosphate transferase